MKRLTTSQLIPGMVVAQDVLSIDHQMILNKDTVLTDNMIVKLDMYGILTVYINKAIPLSGGSVPPGELSYSARIKSSEEFKKFKAQYEKEVDSFKIAINEVVERNAALDVTALLKHSLDMLDKADGKIAIFDMLQNMREYDDTTYAHCLNVGLICNIFASWLKLSPEETELVSACGLLHDIGKLLIPLSIINKPGKLTDMEYNEMKKHPHTGYRLLTSKKINEHICNAALMHHERCDGSGYPLGLKRDQIDRFAKIVAIADVYDAMTAARVYRGPMCPFQVIEIFESEGFQKYDVQYIMTFLEHVADTYIRNRCLLSDNRTGDIIFIDRNHLSRPIVQCGTEYVNLAEEPEIFIECLL